VDQAHNTLTDLLANLGQGHRPMPHLLRELSRKHGVSVSRGLTLPVESQSALKLLGIS
jgi:hypothetical protein